MTRQERAIITSWLIGAALCGGSIWSEYKGFQGNRSSASVVSTPEKAETFAIALPSGPTGEWAFCSDVNGPRPLKNCLQGAAPLVVLPTGYTASEKATYFSDLTELIQNFQRTQSTDDTLQEFQIYTQKKQFLFLGIWLPGGALGTPEANFNGAILKHPLRPRERNLAGNVAAVTQVIARLREMELPRLKPWAVTVLYNEPSEQHLGANAVPPSLLGKPYGVAKVTSRQARFPAPNYYLVHELAHAGLNFADEYLEAGLEGTSIRSLDKASFLSQPFWRSIQVLSVFYDLRLSEIIAGNGIENIALTEHPSRVQTDGYTTQNFNEEGGMFFGKGVWHNEWPNIMRSKYMAHSPPQVLAINASLEGKTQRPNDRIRIAGPNLIEDVTLGSASDVMVYDGDKNHPQHPTLGYDVQIQFEENVNCNFFGFNCENRTRTIEKTIAPTEQWIEVESTALYRGTEMLQSFLCWVRDGQLFVNQGLAKMNLCEVPLQDMANTFLPTSRVKTPYQDFEIPLPLRFTHYRFRFRTDNGTWKSGFTGWQRISRSF